MNSNHLRAFAASLLVILLAAPPVAAKDKKAERLWKDGQKAELNKDWDTALEAYERAVALEPADARYIIAMRKARFQAGMMHVDLGQKLRAQGQVEQSIAEFQKAILKDPSSAIALQEWRRTSEILERERRTGKTGEGPDRGLTPAERAQKDEEQRLAAMLPPPELKPVTRIINVKMNNQPPRVLFDTIGKLAGVNVVFDPQYTSQGKNYNIDLTNTGIEQALDYLAVLTKTFWKPISANTIFVTEDNVTKRRDYEDNVVKVFYIKNATSVQEFQEIATAVRSLVEIRRVFTYNAQKAIVLRDTVDKIALAEKVIHDLDKPKGEVVVDVIVMEANRSRTRDLAAAIMSAGAAGLNIPVQFTPRNPVLSGNTTNNTTNNNTTNTPNNPNNTGNPYNNYNPYGYGGGYGGYGGYGGGYGGYGGYTGTTTQNSAVSLAQLGHISTNDFSTTLPGALLNLVMQDQSTKVMQRPSVRASDGQKVTLRIGDKIPFASGSFGFPGAGGVGVGGAGGGYGYGVAQTQFQFADVGVNVDITPQIHGTDEVTLKMAVEISQVRSNVNIGGISQPIIGQRKSETELRLREGEVNILGGLSQDQDSRSLSGIPGLIDIPALGRVLGSEHSDKERGELLIAVIPHIVRTPGYTEENLRGIYAGTDQVAHVSYAPRTDLDTAPSGTERVAPQPTAPAPAQPPAAAPAQPAPAQPAPAQPAPAQPSTPAGLPRLTFGPPVVQAAVGSPITVTLQMENASDVFSAAPIRIKYDPRVLRLTDIIPGELLSRDGQRVTTAKDIRNDTGEATFTISRPAGAPGANGSGALATFVFSAIGKGNGNVLMTDFNLRNSQNAPLTIAPAPLQITVQ